MNVVEKPFGPIGDSVNKFSSSIPFEIQVGDIRSIVSDVQSFGVEDDDLTALRKHVWELQAGNVDLLLHCAG